MKTIFYALTGVTGGLLAGMGMGGGTVLIPLLVIFFSANQHTAQAVNLVSFIPTAAVSLIIHFKNKLVRFDYYLYIIVPAVATAVLGSFIQKNVDAEILKRFFGGFLILLSISQFWTQKLLNLQQS